VESKKTISSCQSERAFHNNLREMKAIEVPMLRRRTLQYASVLALALWTSCSSAYTGFQSKLTRLPIYQVPENIFVKRVESSKKIRNRALLTSLTSSFYDDFEDFVSGGGDDKEENGGNKKEDDEEDDGDEDDEIASDVSAEEKAKIEMFRTQMMMGNVGGLEEEVEKELGTQDEGGRTFSSVDDLISFAAATSQTKKSGVLGDIFSEYEATQWARPLIDDPFNTQTLPASYIAGALNSGVVLLANPEKFCSDINLSGEPLSQKNNPSPNLLSKFALTLPPPPELGPERRADLLPVLILLDRHPLRGSQAVLLNRRTGYLLGDLEQQQPLSETGPSSNTPGNDSNSGWGPSQAKPSIPPKLGAFMIQPLWFGGSSAGSNGAGGGLDMLHQCPPVKGCRKLTEDGLYWGGDPIQAQEAMNDPSLERPLSGFEFKFFVQSTRWLPTQVRLSDFKGIVISFTQASFI